MTTSLAVYFQQTKSQENSWWAVNDFVVYQQNFAWGSANATEYMFWNITALNGNTADIQLSSHGVQVTNGTANIPSAEVNLKVNMDTRQVAETSDQTGEMPVGSFFPFWMPQSAKEGDFVQTSYGDSTISPSQTMQVLGQSHDCWLVAYHYSAGNDMNRYYDTITGICLVIQTHILSNGVSVL